MMRTKINWNKAKSLAYEALDQHKVSDFPIDILAILGSHDDIKIISYSTMAKKRNCSIEEIIEVNGSKDGALSYSGKRGKYLIAYNDAIDKKERVYWTLAHEYGHYLLGHHKETDRSSLARNAINEAEYDTFEIEADFFARFFLSPPPLIVETQMFDYQIIMDFFGVSKSAAQNTLGYIHKSHKQGFNMKLPNKIARQFTNFINKVLFGKCCTTCGTYTFEKDVHFCSICGKGNFIKGESETMIYSKVEINEVLGVPDKCPKCSNEKIFGEYCQVCGTYMVNKCTGLDEGDYSSQFKDKIHWHLHEGGCGQILEGDARFCSSCGSTSTFYEDGLLLSWQNEMNAKENEAGNDPFPRTGPRKLVAAGDTLVISDDLPF